MAVAGTSAAQPGPSTAQPTGQAVPASIQELLEYLIADQDPSHVSNVLKSFVRDSREVILASLLPTNQDPLEILNPETQTLGFLYILSARLNVSGAPPPQLEAVEVFCKQFDPVQARMAPDRVTALAKGLVRQSGDNVKHALGPLRDLALRYPLTPSHLTTIHSIFLNACLISKHFSAALPILSTPILAIDTNLSDINYNDNLLYHYAGGIALGALKRWREAEEFFEIVVTAPAQVPAAIQLEALKKLSLVQLILYGKASAPPKYTNPVLVRLIKNSPYYNFTKSYPLTVSALVAAASKDEELYRNERNWGLIQQVIARAPRWLVKKLTLTYLTLGLGDIGAQIGVESEEDVRALILDMVDTNDITASISFTGTVTFSDSVAQFSKTDVDRAVLVAQEQSALLLQLERDMNLSKEYLTKAMKHKDEAWGAPDEDMYGPSTGGGWADDF